MNAARRVVFDNGLIAIARPNHAARSIAVRLVLEAGAAFDPDEKEGTSALLAELLDRGAGPYSAAEMAAFFDDLGVAYDATARRDTVEIELRLLSGHFRDVLERLQIIAAEPTLPEEEIRRQKSQMLTAIAERDQDTAAVAEMSLCAALFPPGHPYHRPVRGTRDSIPRIERRDLAGYHRERFGPEGTILSMAGDFDPSRALRMAQDVFGPWRTDGSPGAHRGTAASRQARARASIPDPPAPESPIVVVRPIEGKTQADLALGFKGLRRLSPDLPAALVLNSVLGEFGLGGRLGKSIRDRAGLAYYAHSYFTAGLGAGPFMARAGVAPERVRRALALMRLTIQQLVRRGVSAAELRDSKQALAASVPRRMETNREAAAVLADAEFYGLGIDFPSRLPGLIRAVSKEDVESAARTYLTPRRSVLVVAGPALDKETLE